MKYYLVHCTTNWCGEDNYGIIIAPDHRDISDYEHFADDIARENAYSFSHGPEDYGIDEEDYDEDSEELCEEDFYSWNAHIEEISEEDFIESWSEWVVLNDCNEE